jgi:exodeoxyribonuclease V alpha subunit
MSLLTREILYTGITRAKKNVVVYGTSEIVAATVGEAIVRHSGLAERITKTDGP